MISLEPMRGKTLLITGATGLIGSNLTRAFLYEPQINLTALGHSELPEEASWKALPKFDYIIHAAGYAAPLKFCATPLDELNTAFLNTTSLMILLTKLNENGRLLFLSTSEVYSGSPQSLHMETDIGSTSPAHPRACYIESKRCGEAIIHAARKAGICAIAARVSLAYGPGVRKADKRVMSEFIDSALKFNFIQLKDGGSDRRIYCYISDITEMLLTIIMHGQSAIYNVGGVSETSIVGLARKIGELLRVPVKVPRNMAMAVGGSPAHVGLSMARYTQEFGERGYVGWDEGLANTIEWHKQLVGEG